MSRAGSIRIALPSSPIREGAERAAFDAGCAWLAARGHAVEVAPFVTGPLPFLAGPDPARAEALVAAFEGASCVWMGRGGYGAIRTLEQLRPPPSWAPSAPLWGFSDGTALLGAWVARGWEAWSAPPVTQLARLDTASARRVEAALAGESEAPFEGLDAIVPGEAEGALAGGNLAVLASLVGTPFMPDLAGAIVVLEDIGEAAYRVDRLLQQLRLAGAFDAIAGVVVGDFLGVSEAESALVDETLAAFFEALGRPAWRGLPIGHGRRNAPLRFGHRWRLGDGALALGDSRCESRREGRRDG